MALSEEDIKNLGKRIDEYTNAAQGLADEVRESKEITQEIQATQVAIRKTQKTQTYLLIGKLVTIVLVVILMGIVVRGQTSGNETARAIKSCTSPSGACAQRNNTVTQLVTQLIPLEVEDKRLADVIQANKDQNNMAVVTANQKVKDVLDKQIAGMQAQLDILTKP